MTSSTPGRSARSLSCRVALCLLPLFAACASLDNPAVPQADTAASGAAMPPVASIADAPTGTEVGVPVPIDPVEPSKPVRLEDRSAQVDLWQRVRIGFAIPNLDNDQVHKAEQWYSARPDYVARMTERGGRYLFHIVEELERRGMPTELALLPFVESAFNPQAISSARASGMWQFIPSTGKDYSLAQNVFRDDRRDVLASTRAALDYFEKLHNMFGDWQLALAAYNWGEGNVAKAIARNEKLGLPTDYSSLKMPNETAYYVPKLQALKNIVLSPGSFDLALPALKNHPYFLSVPIENDMDVTVAVKLAGMTIEEFRYLNPQMNKPVILAAGTPQVLLPYDNANEFVRELPKYRGRLASWTAWVAPKTLRPADAARQVGMSEADLRELNRIPPRMLIKVGSTLVVPRRGKSETDVSSEIADNAVMSLSPDRPPMRKLSLKAGRRESVASVARRYRVSAAQVADWNDVATSARFKPGQTVVVFIAHKTTGKTSAHVTGKKATRHAPRRRSTRTETAPASRKAKSTTRKGKQSTRGNTAAP